MELKVQERKIFGKKTKTLRNEGFIPAEIYGHGVSNKHISVPKKSFLKIFKEAGENTVINLVTDKNKEIPVLISYIHKNNLKGKILTVDFHEIKMDEKIQIKVPFEFLGEAPASEQGFLVIHVLNELEIEALPGKIPHRIEVDLSKLEIAGQNIRVSDLKISKEIKVLASEDAVIVAVTEAQKEEEITPPVTTEGETQTPETETTTEPAEKSKENKET